MPTIPRDDIVTKTVKYNYVNDEGYYNEDSVEDNDRGAMPSIKGKQ